MRITSIENNSFTINLIVFNLCNYNCSYCPSRLKDGSQQKISAEDYINFFSNLFSDNPQIFNYPRREVSFTGGEPSIYPEIENLLKFFKENNFENSIITNGSAKVDFWNKNFSNIDTLCLSFHPRYGNYRHVTEVINIFKNNNHKFFLNILMDKDYWSRAIEAAEYFESQNIRVVYKGILDKHSSSRSIYYVDYSQEQLDFLARNTTKEVSTDIIVSYSNGEKERFDGQKIISNKLNHLSGYICDAGVSSLAIKWDGEVTGAQCREKIFGNLSHNKNLRIKLLQSGLICRKTTCACVYDLKINKKINDQ
jgi:organic radical activating enzyme